MGATLGEETRQHIVIVEDDTDIRDLMAEVLAEEGYAVTSYATVTSDVLAALQARPPALLICDLHVPGSMTGADLIRLVTSNARTLHIPIILCSASRRLDTVADSFDGRSVRVLEKPFELDYFLATVTGVLYEADGPTV